MSRASELPAGLNPGMHAEAVTDCGKSVVLVNSGQVANPCESPISLLLSLASAKPVV